MQGFAGSPVWETLELRVEACVNVTMDWRCHDAPDIATFISTYLTTEDFFKVELYMIDTVISPQDDVFIKKVLED